MEHPPVTSAAFLGGLPPDAFAEEIKERVDDALLLRYRGGCDPDKIARAVFDLSDETEHRAWVSHLEAFDPLPPNDFDTLTED